MYEHKKKLVKGFTQKYSINKLVYFEETQKIGGEKKELLSDW